MCNVELSTLYRPFLLGLEVCQKCLLHTSAPSPAPLDDPELGWLEKAVERMGGTHAGTQ